MIDDNKVDEFVDNYCRATGKFRLKHRREILLKRIQDADLEVNEKIEVIRMLSPRGSPTGFSTELRMELLICSIPPKDLSWLKFSLDYDGDYKDMEEYIFHDIDNEDSRSEIISHFKKACELNNEFGTKLLTDVDDTLYANLVDSRYPKQTFYPGVLELYEALTQEPFTLPLNSEKNRIPITTLSARPNPITGTLEEGSLKSLEKHTNWRLAPTALSGKVISSTLGTLQTLGRKTFPQLPENFDKLEQEIGTVKFNNFQRYAKIYPEYKYVFFGDSGQADALTADLMLESSDRVIVTFIHDLRQFQGDRKATSSTFRKIIKEADKRMIVFRNHIDAAKQAFERFGEDLLCASELTKVTKTALDEFRLIKWENETAKQILAKQYRDDAQEVVNLLLSLKEDVTTITDSLNNF